METERDAFYGRKAWVAWLLGLDLESRRAVAPFNERLWHLLMLAIRCPGAIDLLHSSPALAFALASSWVFRRKHAVQRPLRAARSLLRKRQRLVADWLGFPATESVVRILRRVPHTDISVDSILRLREALWDDQKALVLRHLPAINYDVIRIISAPYLWPYASPRLLMECATPGTTREETWRMMQDTLAMLEELEEPIGDLVFRSRAQLYAAHDAAAEAYNRIGWRGEFVGEIPAPPLEGTEAIVPLCTVTDLQREGWEQHNCVAMYAARVAKSARRSRDGRPDLYVYRVLWPERATVCIARRNGLWTVEELKCACNQRPMAKTVAVVQEWLAGGKPSMPSRQDYGPQMNDQEPVTPQCDEECLVPF
jgi:hypothetical protein